MMAKLFRQTPLEDSFKCNFNVLIDSVPRTMGLIGILSEWIRFRLGCLRRELEFDLQKKKDRLHLLLALGKILLDIDKAIRIIRKTEKDEDVVPNLMKGFDIDEIQANFIADIKLRNLNREYILNRISDIEGLQKEIAEMEDILADELRQKAVIIDVSVPRVPFHTLWIGVWIHEVCSCGFPHSEISGSMDICSSPKLIAAYHVFHRLLVPRHPPCALIA